MVLVNATLNERFCSGDIYISRKPHFSNPLDTHAVALNCSVFSFLAVY